MENISPEVEIILEMTITLAEEGQLSKALSECKKARRIAPNFDFVYFLMGMIHEKMGLIDDAILSYQKAIAISPRYFEAHDRLWVVRNERERLAYASLQEDSPKIDKAKIIQVNDGEEIPGYYYLSYQSYIYQGFPGHRLLPGKSGLDPMDTYLEQAYIEGVLLRQLFTLQLTTSNPFYIILGSVIGIMLVMPIILGICLFNEIDIRRIIALLIATIPYWVVGIILLWNIGKSIFNSNEEKSYQ